MEHSEESMIEFAARRLELVHCEALTGIDWAQSQAKILMNGPTYAPIPHDERYTDQRIDQLLQRSRTGDMLADNMLRVAAISIVEQDLHIPVGLREYIVQMLESGIKQGVAKSLENSLRDGIIESVINELHRKFGLSYTRNYASRLKDRGAHSASSIVSRALERIGIHMSEDNVVKIWQRVQRQGSPVDRQEVL